MYKQSKALFMVIITLLVIGLLVGCSSSTMVENHQKVDAENLQNQGTNNENGQEEEVIANNNSTKSNHITGEEMKVHFIDVDQGDATLIQTPAGKTILMDAAEKDQGTKIVDYIKDKGIDTIDIVIATHPHADHIGGMAEVISNFNVGQIYMPKVSHTSKTFEDLLLTIKEKGLKVKTAKAGVTLDIDPAIQATILAPNSDEYESLNDYSAVLKVTYGNSSFLITGDAEETSEREMLTKGLDLKTDILRVGHHGSSSSTIQEFLDEVNPQYAVISVGTDNSYGHPHKEIMTRLNNAGTAIYRTDLHGDIIITTDGNSYNIDLGRKTSANSNPKTPLNTNDKETTTLPPTEKININTANLEELQEIIHIGRDYAEQIIDLRPFQSLDELTKVKGIGKGRLKDIIEEGKAYVE